jgi:hypothetical protein
VSAISIQDATKTSSKAADQNKWVLGAKSCAGNQHATKPTAKPSKKKKSGI